MFGTVWKVQVCTCLCSVNNIISSHTKVWLFRQFFQNVIFWVSNELCFTKTIPTRAKYQGNQSYSVLYPVVMGIIHYLCSIKIFQMLLKWTGKQMNNCKVSYILRWKLQFPRWKCVNMLSMLTACWRLIFCKCGLPFCLFERVDMLQLYSVDIFHPVLQQLLSDFSLTQLLFSVNLGSHTCSRSLVVHLTLPCLLQFLGDLQTWPPSVLVSVFSSSSSFIISGIS